MATPTKIARSYEPQRLRLLQRIGELQNRAEQVQCGLKMLRVCAWFEHLRHGLQAVTPLAVPTAYAVGKLIQPDTYRGEFHGNLWAKYARGQRTPGPSTLQDAEVAVPGSTAVLTHPAWDLLDVSRPLQGRSETWLRTRSMPVQAAVFQQKQLLAGEYRRRPSLERTLQMLEHQASSLDALAVEVLLLREAHEAGDRERCFRIGISLHSMLLMACSSAPLWNIRMPLIFHLGAYVFPLTAGASLVVDLPLAEFHELTHCFNTYALILEDLGVLQHERGGGTQAHLPIIQGQYGIDLRFAFAPRLKAVNCSDRVALAQVARRDIAKEWGLSVLRRGGCEKVVPEEVLAAMHEATASTG